MKTDLNAMATSAESQDEQIFLKKKKSGKGPVSIMNASTKFSSHRQGSSSSLVYLFVCPYKSEFFW